MTSDFTLAVHCLMLLARHKECLLTSEKIAESASVHPVRARKMLALLKKSGYLGSKEGTAGGFFMAFDPDRVTLDELYQLVASGSLQPKCPKGNPDCVFGANIEKVLHQVFQESEQQLSVFLRGFTINQLLDMAQKK